MSSLNKGIDRVEVRLKWDPSPLGAAPTDLDIIAATYHTNDPAGRPAYLVYFDSRSPDGTITLNRDSLNGQGLGYDEVMSLELGRLSSAYGRVVVGVVIQQAHGRMTFGQVARSAVQVSAGRENLAEDDFGHVAGSTAATVAEFTRGPAGDWHFHPGVHGYDGDPNSFAKTMGNNTPS
jgi:tellurium resistance protein TerD